MFNNIYVGKKILVTGNCGFCGSWLCLWLKQLGAEVIGYGHPPQTEPSHHTLLGHDGFTGDLLNNGLLKSIIEDSKAELIIHLAAKAIVAKTFAEPQVTFENNVMGAVNILEAIRQCPSVKGIVMVTTDIVYENENRQRGCKETDKLGGKDSYSASKVCVEQVIRCYRESYGLNIATARAGNIIGGGDWSYKRLIPDIVRAASKGEKVVIHTPNAPRPFQHVLEPLKGYLMLGQKILEGKNVNSAYNFGPEGEITVLEILQTAQAVWSEIRWEIDSIPTHPSMVYLLRIDSTKARKELGWKSKWNAVEAVKRTILWYKAYYKKGYVLTGQDITNYKNDELGVE